ncbi:DUF1887 domain-containing protein, partial [Prochlorothrix hollandica]
MNSLHIPDAYRADHLFLLLGENNLPNAVAALELVNPRGMAYLIHTDRTRSQAQHLQTFLQDSSRFGTVTLVDLATYQAEPSVIRQRLREVATDLPGRVGMNYTGGTKVMAVHAYRFLAHRYPDTIFSYLDSNTLEMVIDNEKDLSPRFKVPLKLSFKSLFYLHGLRWQGNSPPRAQPLLPAAAVDFATLHQDQALGQAWRSWCHQVLCATAKVPPKQAYWRKEWQLEQLEPLAVDRLPVEWLRVLQRHLACGSGQWNLQAGSKVGLSAAEAQPLTTLCQWLDGVWLEHYTLAQVQQIADSCGIHEAKMSFNITDPQNPQRNGPKFEFDVAFIRHYQLFALSCSTTGSQQRCKQKLLEARVRSRQLGGIEARVGLVCLSDRPEWLQEELATETRDR